MAGGVSLSGPSNPPSVAAVTTTIVVVQTIIGLLGFWVAGSAFKSIIKSSTMRHAPVAIWFMLIHGISEVRATSALIRMKSDHHARTSSCLPVADHIP
jgi:divalent metal cation (Fe/Co/Zn/Cd) transporter